MGFLAKVSFYLLVICVFGVQVQAGGQGQQGQITPQKPSDIDETASDSDIIRAINDRRREHFIEGGSLVVTKLLPDDNSGLEHQKWVVRLSNGEKMQAVYNLDMCPRVPLKEGDVIAMGGEFVWTNKGGLLHWLHHDPRGRRPNGYVLVNGKFYCKE